MYQYLAIAIGLTSLVLQLVIFFDVRKYEKHIAENIFEGVFFKVKEGYTKKVLLFYYYPKSWLDVNTPRIKAMLLINCIAAYSFVILLLFFN